MSPAHEPGDQTNKGIDHFGRHIQAAMLYDDFRAAPARLVARDWLWSRILTEPETADDRGLPDAPVLDGFEFLEVCGRRGGGAGSRGGLAIAGLSTCGPAQIEIRRSVSAGPAAEGQAPTLLEVMAGAHERPVGLWHAEWNALPSLFGLASLSGALREARTLAEGLVVDAGHMRANIDAAARRLAPKLGREAADRFEQAAEQVLKTRTALYDVLAGNSEVRDTAWT
jgi:hypothetical protein